MSLDFGSDIVAARRSYNYAKDATDRVVGFAPTSIHTLDAERRAAQALIDAVSAWYDERNARAADELREALNVLHRSALIVHTGTKGNRPS